jgi:phosphoglycerate dehydrogenase-like enzyme
MSVGDLAVDDRAPSETKLRVVIFSQVGPKLTAVLAELLPDATVVAIPTAGEIDPELHGEVLLSQTWGSDNLAELVARGVRWIHVLGTGVDRFPFDRAADCTVTCSRGASAIPISEYVLAAMLAFEKRIPQIWLRRQPERWYGDRLGGLYQRTLGLVGLGAIGLAVAERALAFEMEVIATRRSNASSPLAAVEITSLNDLAARADHIVIAASATPETAGLVGPALFAKMKRGVHLINVARGSLVDQEALRTALDAGIVAHATLDTMQPEPLPDGHWMYADRRISLTPHVSWSMPGAVDLLMEKFVRNVQRYRSGRPLENVVDRDLGY